MIFLLFAIIFGSLFAVVFKICQRRQIDTAQVILFNYVTAIVFSVVPMLLNVARGELSLRIIRWARGRFCWPFFREGCSIWASL